VSVRAEDAKSTKVLVPLDCFAMTDTYRPYYIAAKPIKNAISIILLPEQDSESQFALKKNV